MTEARVTDQERSRKPKLTRVTDLLAPDEREALQRDLAEIARCRRHALDAAATMPIGGAS